MSVMIPNRKKDTTWHSQLYTDQPCSVASKIMERLVKRQLTTYLICRKLVTNSQHGFLQNKPCATRMSDCLNTITNAANAGTSVMVVYLDTTKAFHRAFHFRLISSKKPDGIDSILLWSTSYNNSILFLGQYEDAQCTWLWYAAIMTN